MKTCSKCNIPQIDDCFSKNRKTCKGCIFFYKKEYGILNKDQIKKNKQLWNKGHQEQNRITAKKWKEVNKDYLRMIQYQWKQENLEHVRKVNRERQRSREATDVNFKLSNRLRNRLYCALKNSQKIGSAVDDLGCSVEELRKYLESKFYYNLETGEAMSWDNWGSGSGTWQIDHIKQLSNFNLCLPEEFKEACNYTNLQPLWFDEHLKKTILENWGEY